MTLIGAVQAKLIWRKCYALLDDWAPEIRARLPRGVTTELIVRAEACLGRSLPPSVAELYKVHNGLGLPAVVERRTQLVPLLSLEDALAEWRHMISVVQDPTLDLPTIRGSKGVQAAYWLQGWLPIATFGNGDMLFIDLDPAAGGRSGQVVEWRHEDDSFLVRYRDIGHYMNELDVDMLADLAADLTQT